MQIIYKKNVINFIFAKFCKSVLINSLVVFLLFPCNFSFMFYSKKIKTQNYPMRNGHRLPFKSERTLRVKSQH